MWRLLLVTDFSGKPTSISSNPTGIGDLTTVRRFFSPSYGKESMIQVKHKKRMRTEGLSFHHPSLLCCPDLMLAVMELGQHLVSSSKTVRPIIPRGARCGGACSKVWFAVCLLTPRSQFAEEARPNLRVNEPKRPTPIRRRLSLAQADLVKLIPICLGLTLEVDVLCVPCQVRPLGSTDAKLR